jgi:hypothetical protein
MGALPPPEETWNLPDPTGKDSTWTSFRPLSSDVEAAFNWLRSPAVYITPERSNKFWFETYSSSAQRFQDIASKAGADG